MKNICKMLMIFGLIIWMFLNTTFAVSYSPVYDFYSYEKIWNNHMDESIQDSDKIFIATITDKKTTHDKQNDNLLTQYTLNLHASWWTQVAKNTQLETTQALWTQFGGFLTYSYDVWKTFIFFTQGKNFQVREIGQSNSIKYLSKMGKPDFIYSTNNYPFLVDLGTFRKTKNTWNQYYEDKNFLYQWSHIIWIKNSKKLINKGWNIYLYENRILLKYKNYYLFYGIIWKDFAIKEVWKYHLLQNNGNLYGLSKNIDKQVITLIKDFGHIHEIKYKFWNFYEDSKYVYYIDSIQQGADNLVSQKILKNSWDFELLSHLKHQVNYRVYFQKIPKDFFQKVYNLYENKIKNLSFDEKMNLWDKITKIRTLYLRKYNSENHHPTIQYQQIDFLTHYLISRIQLDTKQREVSMISEKWEQLLWNVYKYDGKIMIKKWNKYFYHFNIADDFQIKMVNKFVLIYNNKQLYSVNQEDGWETVMRIAYHDDYNKGFDLDTFEHVTGNMYKSNLYHYLVKPLEKFDTPVTKFWYDIWGINKDYIIQSEYDFDLRVAQVDNFLITYNREYQNLKELSYEEKQKYLDTLQWKMKYLDLWDYQFILYWFEIQFLKENL